MPTFGAELELYMPNAPYRKALYHLMQNRPFYLARDASVAHRKAGCIEIITRPGPDVPAVLKALEEAIHWLWSIDHKAHPTPTSGLHIHFAPGPWWFNLPAEERGLRSVSALADYFLHKQNDLFTLAYGDDWPSNPAYLARHAYCRPIGPAEPEDLLLSIATGRSRYHACNPFPRPKTAWEVRLWPSTTDSNQLRAFLDATAELALSVPWDKPLLMPSYLPFRRTKYAQKIAKFRQSEP